MNTNTGITTATETPSNERPCDCQFWRIDMSTEAEVAAYLAAASRRAKAALDSADFDDAGWRYAELVCGQTTRKRFAPGHDARVKGLLQAAYRANLAVTYLDGGMAQTGDADAMIRGLSESLADQIRADAPVKAPRQRKAPSVVTETTPETSTPAAKTVKPGTVYAKVGRWTYEGEVRHDEFHFRNARGVRMSTFNYTIVQTPIDA